MIDAYQVAQRAIGDLKAAIHQVLRDGTQDGQTNEELSRNLGIYLGHSGYEGYISLTLLAVMEMEGVVQQDRQSKRWKVKVH